MNSSNDKMTTLSNCVCGRNEGVRPTSPLGKNAQRVMCPYCVQKSLMPIIQKYKAVREERDKRREWCAQKLLEIRQDQYKKMKNNGIDHHNDNEEDGSIRESTGKTDLTNEIRACEFKNDTPQLKTISQLKFEFEKLYRKVNTLTHDTHNLSIQVASLQLSNDNREAKLIQSRLHIENTHNSIQKIYQDCALDGLNNTLFYQKERIRKLRFQLILRLFKMFDLQIGEESEKLIVQLEKEENIQHTETKFPNEDGSKKINLKQKQNKSNYDAKLSSKSISTTTATTDQFKAQRKNPKGYGKIAGLRLPHAGLMYYALFRPVMITSALRHVASLTCSIAQCLKIDLPHPVLLRPCITLQHDIIDQSEQVISDGNNRHKNNDVTNSNYPEYSTTNDHFTPSYNSHDNTAKAAASTIIKKIIPEGLSNISRVWSRPRQSSHTYNNSSSFRQLSKAMRSNIAAKEPAINIDNTKTTSTTTIDDEVLISVIDDRHKHHHSNPDQYVAHASYAILLESCNANKKFVNEYALIYQSSHPDTAANKHGSNIDQDKNHQLQPQQQKHSHAFPQKNQNHKHHDAENHFNIGIQLLQNDVIALCIHAGVSVEKLWPAEAILLNLHSLLVYCQQQMK